MDAYLYVIESSKNGKYYIGATENLERRLREHNRGQNISTRGKGPWKLIYIEKFDDIKLAKKRELEIKRKKRKSYINWLIENYCAQNGPVA